ncbi:MAG: HAMP domain-containing sensor histidine kinase [Campylobacterota bacterium]|nr:HAMP domain-containing sensor histidine kinase [Campylobacterota bacterium]
MARLVTISVLIFVIFSLFLVLVTPDNQDGITPIFLIGLAFLIFIFFIYRGAVRMEKELITINKYLANIDEIDEVNYKARFFTKEFEELNKNLIVVLKKGKKREDIKQRYNAKLKLKNQQRADMISAIAHEFRNPIASIMGYAQTLEDDPHIPKALQEKFLNKIYNNGNKIESLLARLILWNKFESGEATLYKNDFDLYALIQEVKVALEEQYKNRRISIEGEVYIVHADRTLIEVVLKNLIENALKYSKDDVIVKVREDGVFITDTGVGISDKDLEKVTKKFYRSGTHNWDNSMGLGLSIVKTILALHKSKLQIESKLNQGSTFSFYIE